MEEQLYVKSKAKATEKQIQFAERISKEIHKPIPVDMSYEEVNHYIKTNLQAYNVSKETQNKNVIDEIKSSISIVDFAQEIGLSPIRKGKYFSLKEHDSVIIEPNKNCYWQNSVAGTGSSIGNGGSVIDFALTFYNSDLQTVLKEFSGRLYSQLVTRDNTGILKDVNKKKDIEQEENHELVLPSKADSMRNVFAYLCKTRYIDTDIVQYFTDQKMIYQDDHRNCVFVSYEDEKPVFASLRGTNTYGNRFVGDVKNSNYAKGFYISNNSKKLIVTESVIDAFSVMTILKGNGIDYKDYDYAPLCGAAKFDSVVNRLISTNSNVKDIYMALDNDEGGITNMHLLEDILKEKGINVNISENLPNAKDWNQELKDSINQCKEWNEIDFFKKNKISPFENMKLEFAKKNKTHDLETEQELEMEI